MEYVARLLRNEEFLGVVRELEVREENRVYCRHDFTHLMDVARLGYLYALEEGITLDKEQFYLAALLHDIGRAEEYESGISHAEAGKKLAGEILLHIGYPGEKIPEILAAIGEHRGGKTAGKGLSGLLKRADKESRPCFACKAADTCKWSVEKRNKPENWQ